jgi:hypothetical protein
MITRSELRSYTYSRSKPDFQATVTSTNPQFTTASRVPKNTRWIMREVELWHATIVVKTTPHSTIQAAICFEGLKYCRARLCGTNAAM